jgi:hypothetical protein
MNKRQGQWPSIFKIYKNVQKNKKMSTKNPKITKMKKFTKPKTLPNLIKITLKFAKTTKN